MGKKLAIKGHPTRGKEVIELLEMMGGKNKDDMFLGKDSSCIYFIDNYGFIRKVIIENNIHTMRHWQIFTLEEFLEKYPFYNGDKVFDIADGDPGIITAMKWDEDVSDMKYHVAFDNGDIGWYTNDTIDFYFNKDNKEMNRNIETNQCKVNGLKRGDEYPIMEGVECNEYIKYYFPDGYEFVDTDYTGVYLKPIKPKYPTTYEDCCDKTNFKGGFKEMLLSNDEYSLYISFIKLKRCRDAYWKIYGEELGLGKPWEPSWQKTEERKFCIIRRSDNVVTKWETKTIVRFLAFPTEEMRDAFFDNFKDLIKQCKELL